MQRLVRAALLSLGLLSGSALADVVSPTHFWQYHHELQAEKPLLVDVRSHQEFIAGHLPNAINIPHDKIAQLTTLAPDKSQPIFLYCRSGHRAGLAESVLKQQGYTRIYNGESYQALLESQPK
ncbi:rhodanese-like domain-containing protein [Photobacterium aphoticum]|uniref:Phage-shock protein n=1 Tax=Photobacterium aphoticum TaxID=754436 RepID=A0A0J1GGR9_9GAMM|nr:rhodanese-like domain-containing protein [Photobacterium aphoticum]KLU98750.1 phage-shock protein [Photobacterium aphoticum]PSU54842.1 rhodanese-like domain-containing protein [Photobacterium aphoticum]GHA65111.1 hypothetical protein GCM10007086_43380 [Photobacterium aphoticum]